MKHVQVRNRVRKRDDQRFSLNHFYPKYTQVLGGAKIMVAEREREIGRQPERNYKETKGGKRKDKETEGEKRDTERGSGVMDKLSACAS